MLFDDQNRNEDLEVSQRKVCWKKARPCCGEEQEDY